MFNLRSMFLTAEKTSKFNEFMPPDRWYLVIKYTLKMSLSYLLEKQFLVAVSYFFMQFYIWVKQLNF